MTYFRALLGVLLVGMLIYTAFVVASHGPNFLSVFLSDIASITWRGQFNLDFAGYLLLSGLWIVWRNGFTPGGWALGVSAAVLGMPVFAAYLLALLARTKGDLRSLLLGVHARSTP